MEVIAAYRHISGDRFVDEDESSVIAVQHFEIGGRWISCDVAELRNDGPFLIITLRHAEPDEDYPYLQRSVEQIRELRATLTADQWLEATDDDTLVLPVSKLAWMELVTA